MHNFFTTYKNPVTVLIVIILLGGAFAYSKMQTALFPEITFPKIKVIADAGQQPVNKMMITVTRQLETAIKQIPDLQTIRSTTSRGSCEISAFMNWDDRYRSERRPTHTGGYRSVKSSNDPAGRCKYYCGENEPLNSAR